MSQLGDGSRNTTETESIITEVTEIQLMCSNAHHAVFIYYAAFNIERI